MNSTIKIGKSPSQQLAELSNKLDLLIRVQYLQFYLFAQHLGIENPESLFQGVEVPK